MPTLRDGPKGRPTLSAPLLADLIAQSHVTRLYVEYVGPRPTDGSVGAFSFGRSRGVVEGVLGALSIPAEFMTPASWKRAVGLPAGREGAKEAARALAIARWPAHAALFSRVRDHNRAESALIGLAGLIRAKDRWR